MKVLLNVKEISNGSYDILSDDGSLYISNWNAPSYKPEEHSENKSSIKNVLKLKEAGFTADDILEMKKEGLI